MWLMKEDGMKESRETYLKVIYQLSVSKTDGIRNIDIANKLSVSRPSVTRAISVLKNAGFINVNHKGYIYLTLKGETDALKVIDKYKTIVDFLSKHLECDDDIIYQDACKLEHVISDDLYIKIRNNINC